MKTKYFYRIYTLDNGNSYMEDIVKVEYETIGNTRNTKITSIFEKIFIIYLNDVKLFRKEKWDLNNFSNYSSILTKMNYPGFGPRYNETRDKKIIELFENEP